MEYETRYDIESHLASEISEVFWEDYRLLEEEPDGDFWDKERKKLEKVIIPILIATALWGIELENKNPEISLDNVVMGAAEWAKNYSYDLISGLTEKSRIATQRAFFELFMGNISEEELKNRLSYWFGAYRAELISITEVTRAIEQGKDLLKEEILRQFPELRAVETWHTSEDEKVCPLCAPLDGTERGVGWFVPPPIHPGDRCWTTIEYVET